MAKDGRGQVIFKRLERMIDEEVERTVKEATYKLRARLEAKEKELEQVKAKLKGAEEKVEDLDKRLKAAEKGLEDAREFISKIRQGAEAIKPPLLPGTDADGTSPAKEEATKT